MNRIGPQTAMSPRLSIEVAATPESARFLSDLIALYLRDGLGLREEDPQIVRIRLAIVEALTNVARHGYVGRERGTMTLEMERDGEDLVAVVRDFGVAFDPTECASAEIPTPETLPEGGYGLGIIHSVMDELVHARSEADGNLLTMAVKLWG